MYFIVIYLFYFWGIFSWEKDRVEIREREAMSCSKGSGHTRSWGHRKKDSALMVCAVPSELLRHPGAMFWVLLYNLIYAHKDKHAHAKGKEEEDYKDVNNEGFKIRKYILRALCAVVIYLSIILSTTVWELRTRSSREMQQAAEMQEHGTSSGQNLHFFPQCKGKLLLGHSPDNIILLFPEFIILYKL